MIKGLTTGWALPISYSVLVPWIQTSLFSKPEIVFNLSKRIIWAYSFATKTKQNKTKQKQNKNKNKNNRFLLFLKAFSWETDLWVMIGDFTLKNVKLGRKICI